MSIASAYDETLKEYVSPGKAEKGHTFSCVDCKQKVIFRKGTVRVPHFAHYSPTNTCTYFEHPSESQQHKDAKVKLAEWLRDRKIEFINWSCKVKKGSYLCNNLDNCCDEIEHKEGDTVQLEYRDPGGKYVADVAILNNNTVRYIFEVLHTHRTITECRPEPWYEISTEDILEFAHEPDYIPELSCRRMAPKVRKCEDCKLLEEDWISSLPALPHKIGSEDDWKQIRPCIVCGRSSYNPIFMRGFKQLCKICLSNEADALRQKYGTTKPLFRS